MRPLQLVGEGEVLAPTAILAGRLEDVETFLAEEGTEGAGRTEFNSLTKDRNWPGLRRSELRSCKILMVEQTNP